MSRSRLRRREDRDFAFGVSFPAGQMPLTEELGRADHLLGEVGGGGASLVSGMLVALAVSRWSSFPDGSRCSSLAPRGLPVAAPAPGAFPR